VNTSTTPEVQYAYTEMAGGVDNSRVTSIAYPDGYVLTDSWQKTASNRALKFIHGGLPIDSAFRATTLKTAPPERFHSSKP